MIIEWKSFFVREKFELITNKFQSVCLLKKTKSKTADKIQREEWIIDQKVFQNIIWSLSETNIKASVDSILNCSIRLIFPISLT